jgi:hypothetical protein
LPQLRINSVKNCSLCESEHAPKWFRHNQVYHNTKGCMIKLFCKLYSHIIYTKRKINTFTNYPICACHVVIQQYITGIKQIHFKCNQELYLFLHMGEWVHLQKNVVNGRHTSFKT